MIVSSVPVFAGQKGALPTTTKRGLRGNRLAVVNIQGNLSQTSNRLQRFRKWLFPAVLGLGLFPLQANAQQPAPLKPQLGVTEKVVVRHDPVSELPAARKKLDTYREKLKAAFRIGKENKIHATHEQIYENLWQQSPWVYIGEEHGLSCENVTTHFPAFKKIGVKQGFVEFLLANQNPVARQFWQQPSDKNRIVLHEAIDKRFSGDAYLPIFVEGQKSGIKVLGLDEAESPDDERLKLNPLWVKHVRANQLPDSKGFIWGGFWHGESPKSDPKVAHLPSVPELMAIPAVNYQRILVDEEAIKTGNPMPQPWAQLHPDGSSYTASLYVPCLTSKAIIDFYHPEDGGKKMHDPDKR